MLSNQTKPPLLLNDITADIESEIRLFADDCVCYREIKDKEDTLKLQILIDSVSLERNFRGILID